jgi:hypothetical protein
MIIERRPVDAGIMNIGAGREVRLFWEPGKCQIDDLAQNHTGKVPYVTVRSVFCYEQYYSQAVTVHQMLDITARENFNSRKFNDLDFKF